MTIRLAVLGGSSPFTASLVDALVEAAPELPRLEVVLFGRDKTRAALIAEYAQSQFARFGWRAHAADSLPDCLQDSFIVLHQIRYGGLAGRRADEVLCERFGVQYDETLGLGALNALLRTTLQIDPIAKALVRYAPDAWIVNLTNPLSVVTTLLTSEYGLAKTLGVCELPTKTAAMIAAQIGVRNDQLSWAYTGLNHRGFVHDLVVDGEDVLHRLLMSLGERGFATIPAADIAALRAVPSKYYRLLTDKLPAKPSNRANELRAAGEAITAELRHAPYTSPPSLTRRDTSWYREAVVPMVRVLLGNVRGDLVASLSDDDDIAWERKIAIDGGAAKFGRSTPPREVEAILSPLIVHEKAVLTVARRPTKTNIADALGLDPLIPHKLVDSITDELAGLNSGRC